MSITYIKKIKKIIVFYQTIFYNHFMNLYKEPLSRFLISYNLCSQRSAKNFVKNNEVVVNGNSIKDASFLVDTENDTVIVGGKILPQVKHKYIMLNKREGVECSTVSDSHKTVYDLLKGNFNETELYKLKCVGRLDNNTSGLLLLSTNGTFVNQLTSPENEVEKTYFVKLRDSITDKKSYVLKAEKGIEIPPENKSPAFISKSAFIKWLSDDSLEITVTEGKFHEIRRIFSALGNYVVKLKRLKMGDFILDETLNEGEFKFL